MRVNARSLGLQFHGLNAGTDQDIDTIFAGLIQQRIGVLLVSADPFFLQLTPEQQSFRRHLAIRRQRRAAPWNGAAHASCDRDDQALMQRGDRVGNVTLGADRRRRGVGNYREWQVF
jgi:hypothetical protein